MTPDNAVVLTVVIAMFATFMVTLGGVWIWTNLPGPATRKAKAAPVADTGAGDERLAA